MKINKTKKSARKLKSAIKFVKKAIRKTEICKKTSKFYLQQAQKQATRKPSKKPANPQKTRLISRENRKVDNTDVS